MLYKKFLTLRRPCPFCHARERILAERKTAYLTYALAPYSKYHLLVIPKRHITSIARLHPSEEKDIAELVKSGLKTLRRLKVKNSTVLVRDGGRDKSIAHLHYHLIPNHRIGDMDSRGKQRQILTPRAQEDLERKIAKALRGSR